MNERRDRRPASSGLGRARVRWAIVGGVGLAFASVGLATLVLLEAEVVARLLAPDYLLKTRGLHVFSEIYGWTPRTSTTASIDGRRVSVNSSGYRGRELPQPKTGHGTRLVVLGDSIAFGLGVSDHETFSSLLDSRDNGVEVVNLAVQGFDPGQELLVLLRDGLRYAPDVVVLAFCVSNDYAEAMLPVSLYDGTSLKPRFRLVGNRLTLAALPPLRFPTAARVWLSDYSHLFNRAAMLWRPAAPRAADWHERYQQAMRDEGDALRLSLALVREMSRVCRERGIAFLIAAFPDRSSYRQNPPIVERFLSGLATDGIATLDVSARFRARGLRMGAVALDGIGHLSPLGHAVVSEELERQVGSQLGGKDGEAERRRIALSAE
jgi:hypothetical protein